MTKNEILKTFKRTKITTHELARVLGEDWFHQDILKSVCLSAGINQIVNINIGSLVIDPESLLDSVLPIFNTDEKNKILEFMSTSPVRTGINKRRKMKNNPQYKEMV